MNREILFRGKQVDNCEWVYGSYYHCCGTAYGATFIVVNDFGFIEVIPHTVGQYTGLTDKNGTKIFEGDIVYGLFNFGSKIKSKVVFKNGSFGVESKMCGAIHFNAFTGVCNVEWEVIGNIYDNPEMREDEE